MATRIIRKTEVLESKKPVIEATTEPAHSNEAAFPSEKPFLATRIIRKTEVPESKKLVIEATTEPAHSNEAMFPSEKPILVYWAASSRGDAAKSLLHAGGIGYVLDNKGANLWPMYKDQCPFGQMPVLKHGSMVLAQTGAINKYCARLVGLYPRDPIEASECDMIMEECMDIFEMLFKAKNARSKAAKLVVWASIKDEFLPTHFEYLNNILTKSGKPFFGGDKPNAADVIFYAVYGIYDYANCGADKVLAKFPRLDGVRNGARQVGRLADFKRERLYFTTDPEHPSFLSDSEAAEAAKPKEKPVLVYRATSSLGVAAKCLLYAGDIEYELVTEGASSWPAYKDQCPFGQMPMLKHGSLVLAQIGAINKYCARLAGLYPSDPAEASVCDMIMEECMDILGMLFKAKNAPGTEAKLAVWANIKDEFLPTHFGYLDNILEKSGKPFFGGDKPNAADVVFYAVYGVYDYANCGTDKVLAKLPRLKEIRNGARLIGRLGNFRRERQYVSADPEHPSFFSDSESVEAKVVEAVKAAEAAKFPSEKPVLVDWAASSRGDAAKCLLYAGGIEYDLNTDDAHAWPAVYKDQCPFGQMPVLKHGSLVLAQSGSINRYLAILGGLYPSGPLEASVCDMVMDECMDIFEMLFKAKNAPGKAAKLAVWASIQNEYLPTHFGYLDKILEKSEKLFFGGDQPNAADVVFYAVYGVYDDAKCGADKVLAEFPRLKAVNAWAPRVGNLDNFRRGGQYFSADPAHPNFLSDAEVAKPKEKPTLVYWAAFSRGDAAICLLYAGDIDYDLGTEDANSWPASKDQCPFGKIPVLKHGSLVLAQSGAINRYLAQLGGLYPSDLAEASECDMVMDECMDMFEMLFKVKNARGKEAKLAVWAIIKDKFLPTHFGYLNNILEKSGKPFFGGDQPNAADVNFYAVYGVYDHAKCGASEVLDKLPLLKAACEGTKKLGRLADFKREGHDFTADPECPSFVSDSEAAEAAKPKEKPILVCWPDSSRGDTAKCLLYAGGIEYDLDVEGAISSYFGQNLILRHGSLVLSRCGAVNRHCARLSGLYPSDPAEASECDMIMEECMDVYEFLHKAKRAPDKYGKLAGWARIVNEALPTHFEHLEQILEKSGKPFFGGDKPNAADVTFYAVYGVYDNTNCGAREVLAKFPTLKAVYREVLKVGKLSDFKRKEQYFSADPGNQHF